MTTDIVPRPRKRPAPAGRNTLSRQLREILRNQGVSVYRLAKDAGICPRQLGRFLDEEAGRGLSLASADRLALALNLKLGEAMAKPRRTKVATRKAKKTA